MTYEHGATPADWPQRAGAEVLAIEFDDELKAREALLAATRLGRHHAIELADAAIVTADRRGRQRIIQTRDVNPGDGAFRGAWFASIAGLLLFGPVGFAAAAVVGGIAGYLWARHRDYGIDDGWMKRATRGLAPGHAAAFLQVDSAYPTNLLRELRRFDGQLIHNSIDGVDSDAVRDALAYVP